METILIPLVGVLMLLMKGKILEIKFLIILKGRSIN